MDTIVPTLEKFLMSADSSNHLSRYDGEKVFGAVMIAGMQRYCVFSVTHYATGVFFLEACIALVGLPPEQEEDFKGAAYDDAVTELQFEYSEEDKSIHCVARWPMLDDPSMDTRLLEKLFILLDEDFSDLDAFIKSEVWLPKEQREPHLKLVARNDD